MPVKPGRTAPQWIAAALALLSTSAAHAQEDPDIVRRLERQMREADAQYRMMVSPDQPIAERLLLDYGGTARFGFFSIDDVHGRTHILRQYDGRLYVRAELDGAHRFFGRLRFQYNEWNLGDSFDGRGDEFTHPIGEQYWYQFDLRGAHMASTGERLPWNVNARAGKQYIQWGSGLTLSSILYAGVVDVEIGDFGVIGLASITPDHGTVDFDGSRPDFDADTDRWFFGGMFEYRGWATQRPYVGVLVQRDDNDRDFATFTSILDTYPTRFDYNSNYFIAGWRGTVSPSWRFGAELVYENGDGLSNSFSPVTGLAITQTREDIDAWAGLANVTYLLRDTWDSRFDLEFIAGSGDSDRFDSNDTFGGNQTGTDDNSFISLGYVNTGLALAPEPANLFSVRLGASASPFRSVDLLRDSRVGINGFIFTKIDADAPINVQTTDDTFVGGEIDLFFDWRITSDVTTNLRYGVFIPGDAMPDDHDSVRHFLYAGLTYAF